MAPRTAILDAAYDILVARGWGAARMADVAARAGVSRQTLYNAYGSKDGLARAVLLRETARYLDGIAELLARHAGETERAVEAAVLFTHRGRRQPALRRAHRLPGRRPAAAGDTVRWLWWPPGRRRLRAPRPGRSCPRRTSSGSRVDGAADRLALVTPPRAAGADRRRSRAWSPASGVLMSTQTGTPPRRAADL